jgi:quercetin dioxygenase-like cupin family protein
MSVDRPLHGEVLVLDLGKERERATEPALLSRNGRNARTLLKDGPLRVTLVALAPGGEIAEHQAEGPITVQPLTGRVRFSALGRDHDIGPGELLSAGAGVRHAVASADGAVFLLTLALGKA